MIRATSNCLFICKQLPLYNALHAVALGYNSEMIIKTKPKTKMKIERKK